MTKYHSIVWICHILFTYSSVDEYLGEFHLLAIINVLVQTFINSVLSGHVFSFLLGTYPGVELLGQVVTVLTLLAGSVRLFSKWLHTILHFYQKHMSVPILPHPHHHLLLPGFFILAMMARCKMVFHCVFDVHSQMVNDIQHLFLCLMAIYISSLERVSIQILCSVF